MADKPAATWHPGTRPTPRTAADVLREHSDYGLRTEANTALDDWYVCLGCGVEIETSAAHVEDEFRQHQTDMLAATGLLATAEHDQEIAAHAAQAAEEVLVAVATATDRQIVGDDVWQHTTLEIAQNAGSVIEAVNDALLDYRDGWAIDEAERRAAGEVP